MSENLPEGYEFCTTWSRRRRHVSNQLNADGYGRGRAGKTLCLQGGEDQERMDHYAQSYGAVSSVKVAELPLCGLCAKKLAKVVA